MRWASLAVVVTVVVAAPRLVAAAEPSVAECLAASERGQQERDDGRYARARASFGTCASGACPGPVQRDCAEALVDMEASTPTFVFVVRDADGADRPDVVVRMDGAVIATRLDGKPLVVDAGERVFELDVGGRRIERRVLVTAGEKNRVMRIDLEAPASSPPVATLALGTVAVVAAGAAAVLWITAKDDLRAIESSPCAVSRTCAAEDLDSVRARLVAGDVAAGIGVAAAGAALVFWLTRPKGGGSARVGAGGFVVPAAVRWGATF